LTGIRSSGFVGGVHAGANWQARNAWVAGLELDLSGSGIKGSNTAQAPLTGGLTGTDTLTRTDRFELLGSARARLGYLFWPDWLFYGTGGLAWTRMTQTLDEVENVTSGGTSFSTSTGTVNWEFGWVAGFGVETRLWNSNWLARLEYLHYDFGDQGSSFDVGLNRSTGHLTTDVVRGGLSYKFDWGDPVAGAGKVAMPVKAHPIVTADWSGFYLGAHAGYGWGRDPMSQSDFSNIVFFGLDDFQRADVNSNGFVAGFQAGANRQMGAFVGGVEIDISGTGIKGTTTVSDLDNDETLTTTDKFDALGSARGRIGYLALPNVLLYGTGGLGWARLNQTTVDTPLGGGPSGSTTPFWTFGWVAGAGGETRLWNSNWFLRAEYLHYDFGNSGSTNTTITVNAPGFAVGSAATAFSTGHLTTDVVRTGLSYKLN
jgi:outer membrane immunogenic protein